jgi:hypothetical protein
MKERKKISKAFFSELPVLRVLRGENLISELCTFAQDFP